VSDVKIIIGWDDDDLGKESHPIIIFTSDTELTNYGKLKLEVL